MSRLKTMSMSEFSPVLKRGWDRPVALQGDAIPDFLGGVPEDLRYAFIASGEVLAPRPYQTPRIHAGKLIGGIYVYRRAPDDPVMLNRDDYAVISTDDSGDILLVDGPFKHPTEHWADELPVRLKRIDVMRGVTLVLP